MKENNFCLELPDGYRQVFYINAKDSKTGLAFNFAAFILAAAVFVPLIFLADLSPILNNPSLFSMTLLIGCAGLIIYMILHELLHGVAYKLTTGRKLFFGISWSCAFCGVPDIFVTRRTAIIALMTPFTVFTLAFIPALIFTSTNPYIYAALGFVFAMHVGGCAGDLYVFILLAFKYKNKRLLMRDTGPEQFFYLPENNN